MLLGRTVMHTAPTLIIVVSINNCFRPTVVTSSLHGRSTVQITLQTVITDRHDGPTIFGFRQSLTSVRYSIGSRHASACMLFTIGLCIPLPVIQNLLNIVHEEISLDFPLF